MTLVLNRVRSGLPVRFEQSQIALKSSRRAIPHRKSVAATAAAKQVVALPVVPAGISRHIDWYAKGRGLPPLIGDFLDTHWRSYISQSFFIGGEKGQSCRDAVDAMKNLAWSVRPKKNRLSRRRLISLIPQLYRQLHVGLDSAGVSGAEHDAFFAALAKLHQAALNP